VASGYVCNPIDSRSCPAVAQSANGDSMEISGAGTLNPSSKEITATGVFTHKTATGDVVETGIWRATALLNFNSYGIAPGALLLDKQRFRLFGPFPIGFHAGPMPAGGLALLGIQLLPDAGKPKEAILQVNCALGKVPANQQQDGVRLAIVGGGIKFDQRVSGRTMFMLRKPEQGLSSKAQMPAAIPGR
jgi:hypothetical protein